MDKTLRFESETWLAEALPHYGGNLQRLLHKPTNTELIFGKAPDEERPDRFGIPVLFPPNRLGGGKFEWHGKTCTLPLNDPRWPNNHLHGIVIRRAWKNNSVDAHSLKMSYRYDSADEFFKGFPFPFEITVEYVFKPDCVEQLARIRNLGDSELPFGFGFHTYFRTFAPDLTLWVSAPKSHWEISDETKLPTGLQVPWDAGQTAHLPGGQNADISLGAQCPMIDGEFKGKPFRGALLESKSKGLRIVYEAGREFSQWAMWNDFGGKGFICAEPMTCMANAFNLMKTMKDTGAFGLAAGGSWDGKCRISVERI